MCDENTLEYAIQMINKPSTSKFMMIDVESQNDIEELMDSVDIPMKLLSLDNRDYDDDDDSFEYNAIASSRPPPEFSIENYSEDDDAYPALDIRKIPGFEEFVKNRSGINHDSQNMLQYIDEKFLKYGSLYADSYKWETDAYDYYGIDDPDSSISP